MNPEDFDPGPLAHVEHHEEEGRSTLVFVRRLRHSPGRVWAALTEPAQLRRWAPFDPDRDLATPGPATLRMTDGQAVEEYPAEVRRAEAPALLEYTWGDDLLRWELAPDGAGTRLTLRHTVESPDWVPRIAAGWHLGLVVAERLLDGRPIPPIIGREAKRYGWEALHDAYAAKLGIAGKGWPEEVFPEA
jgi:uncharacterized protein YndB with AHSA1/START domain